MTARPAADPPRRGLLVAAGVLLAIPVLALLWVGSYARTTPKLGAFPFFIWYQFLWVFVTAGLTAVAYVLVGRARSGRSAADRTARADGSEQ